jgi:hypothetical protein
MNEPYFAAITKLLFQGATDCHFLPTVGNAVGHLLVLFEKSLAIP